MVANSRGFTLLEVLVALAIFAVVATVSFSAVQRGVDTSERLTEQRRFWQGLDDTFRLLEQDLEMAIARAPRIPGRQGLRAFEGYGRGRPGRGGELLRLTRAGVTSVREGPVSPYRRVAYRIEEGVLRRAAWYRLDVPVRREPREAVLLRGIEDHRIQYWQDEGQRWIDQWPRRLTTGDDGGAGLPEAVRLRLDLGKRGAFERIFLVGPVRPGEGGGGQ
jgi:general secretion pathway protein J